MPATSRSSCPTVLVRQTLPLLFRSAIEPLESSWLPMQWCDQRLERERGDPSERRRPTREEDKQYPLWQSGVDPRRQVRRNLVDAISAVASPTHTGSGSRAGSTGSPATTLTFARSAPVAVQVQTASRAYTSHEETSFPTRLERQHRDARQSMLGGRKRRWTRIHDLHGDPFERMDCFLAVTARRPGEAIVGGAHCEPDFTALTRKRWRPDCRLLPLGRRMAR
jgi:hypothetical protein